MSYDAVSKEEFTELKGMVEELCRSVAALWEVVKLFKPDALPNGDSNG